jgi:hypothetical protein
MYFRGEVWYMRNDVWISVDIEADGQIPGDYSMASVGACVADDPGRNYYAELKPISDKWDPRALAVSGLERDYLIAKGQDPKTAMYNFSSWLGTVSNKDNSRPVLVAFNASFDWSWVSWYFHHFIGNNPFGISGLDIKAYYMGALRKKRWSDTTKRNMEKRFLSKKPHTHNALDDAIEQAEIFMKIRNYLENGDEIR